MLDDNSRLPVYLRLATILREQIRSGRLGPGAAVPSEPYLASEYGVSRQTARKAVEVLREDGYVITHRSRGSVVLPVPAQQIIHAEPGAVVAARLSIPGDPPGSDVTLIVMQPGGEVATGPAARTIVQVTGPEQG